MHPPRERLHGRPSPPPCAHQPLQQAPTRPHVAHQRPPNRTGPAPRLPARAATDYAAAALERPPRRAKHHARGARAQRTPTQTLRGGDTGKAMWRAAYRFWSCVSRPSCVGIAPLSELSCSCLRGEARNTHELGGSRDADAARRPTAAPRGASTHTRQSTPRTSQTRLSNNAHIAPRAHASAAPPAPPPRPRRQHARSPRTSSVHPPREHPTRPPIPPRSRLPQLPHQ